MVGGAVAERPFGSSGITVHDNARLNFSSSAYVYSGARLNGYGGYFYNVFVTDNAYLSMTGGTIESSGYGGIDGGAAGNTPSVYIDNSGTNTANCTITAGNASIKFAVSPY